MKFADRLITLVLEISILETDARIEPSEKSVLAVSLRERDFLPEATDKTRRSTHRYETTNKEVSGEHGIFEFYLLLPEDTDRRPYPLQ